MCREAPADVIETLELTEHRLVDEDGKVIESEEPTEEPE